MSGVTDMSRMFLGAAAFNGNLSAWNVRAVTDMSAMFDGAYSFNGDLSAWDVRAVTDMGPKWNSQSFVQAGRSATRLDN